MSARAKDSKVASALKKLFSPDKKKKNETTEPHNNNNNNNNVLGGPSESPSRRLRRGVSPGPMTRHVSGSVAPMKMPQPNNQVIRSRRLMKEFKEIQKIQNASPNPNFTVELVNDNLYEWHVRLQRVDPDSPLAKDMLEQKVPHILLHLVFPDNFPFAPPFMRVVEPRIEKGYVMDGGAICMELLTPRGWASAYTVEALLMQFSASVVKGQGRIAKNAKAGNNKEFSRRMAEAAFKNLVKTHEKYGWVTPSLSDG